MVKLSPAARARARRILDTATVAVGVVVWAFAVICLLVGPFTEGDDWKTSALMLALNVAMVAIVWRSAGIAMRWAHAYRARRRGPS